MLTDIGGGQLSFTVTGAQPTYARFWYSPDGISPYTEGDAVPWVFGVYDSTPNPAFYYVQGVDSGDNPTTNPSNIVDAN